MCEHLHNNFHWIRCIYANMIGFEHTWACCKHWDKCEEHFLWSLSSHKRRTEEVPRISASGTLTGVRRKAFAELCSSFLCQVKEDRVGRGNGLSVLLMRLTRQMDERLVSRAPLSSNWFSPCAHLEWDYQTMLLRLPLFQQWHGSSCLRLLLKRRDGSDLGCNHRALRVQGSWFLFKSWWDVCLVKGAGEPQRSKPETNFALVCL